MMRRVVMGRGIVIFFVILAGAMAATVNDAQENKKVVRDNESSAREGVAQGEMLVEAGFPQLKSWRGIKSGTVLEGRLALPIYEGLEMRAPMGSQVRVTVNSTEKIREGMSFWSKMGRGISRAFNPIETSRPSEYRVNLETAEIVTPAGNRVTLDGQGLRGRSSAMIRAKSGKRKEQKAEWEVSLIMAVRPDRLRLDDLSPGVDAEGTEHGTRAYILTELRASTNHEGDGFQAQLAEPARIGGSLVPAGTIVEGKVVQSTPPRMLSRAGKMNLKLERLQVQGTDSLRVDGSLSGAESNGKARFTLDEEGTLRGRKPGIWNGLIDLGYAYVVGKIADDIAEAPIRAIGGVISDGAVANAARYVGITAGVAFLITRHGRDVYVPKYAVIEIDFGGRKQEAVKQESSFVRK